MELVDSHCHLDLAAFDADRDQVLARCRALGVRDILVPGVDAEGWPRLLALCTQEAGLHPALGLHPVFLDRHRPEHLAELARRLEQDRPAAVGEIGLDHFLRGLDRQRQRELFEAQLRLARDAGLPVVLHVRKAHDEVLALLRRVGVVGGIAHAFNGSLQQAEGYLALGFRLGFGGTLTYEGTRHIHELARRLPLEAMVLETDAPDMPVAAHRGERNSPEFLPDCLAALARIRDEAPERIAEVTSRNARQVLRLH